MSEYLLMKSLGKLFEEMFSLFEVELTWNHWWVSGNSKMTGIYSNPQYRLQPLRNTFYRMVDGYRRRCIVIGTAMGVVVIYQKEAGIATGELQVVADPKVVKLCEGLVDFENMSERDFKTIVGYDDGVESLSQLVDSLLLEKVKY